MSPISNGSRTYPTRRTWRSHYALGAVLLNTWRKQRSLLYILRNFHVFLSFCILILIGCAHGTTNAVQWRFLSGSTIVNMPGNLGPSGQFSRTYTPGSRGTAALASSSRDDLVYLFGGVNKMTTSIFHIANDIENLGDYRQSGWSGSGAWGSAFLVDFTFMVVMSVAMRRRKSMILFAIPLLLLHQALALNSVSWRWLSGSSVVNQPSVGGPQGQFSPNYSPSSRSYGGMTSAFEDTIYLFGGEQYSNAKIGDVWAYRQSTWTSTGEWAWLGGRTDSTDYGGQYSGPTPYPGGRWAPVVWICSPDPLLCIFGGSGPDSTGIVGLMNDIWSFNPSTYKWIWLKGSSLANPAGVFGTKGIVAASNTPPSLVKGALLAKTAAGDVWIFGGVGGAIGDLKHVADTWMYNSSINEWAWMNGQSYWDTVSVVGSVGVFATTHCPGSRFSVAVMTASPVHVYIYGGFGRSTSSTPGYLADLWAYNVDSSEWAFISGHSSGANFARSYGILGVFAPTNDPGGRYSYGWSDPNSDLMYLGFGPDYNSDSNHLLLGDMWAWNMTKKVWAWIAGDSTPGSAANYTDSRWFSVLNDPGQRYMSMQSTRSDLGLIYIFGGRRSASAAGKCLLNDFWVTKGASYVITPSISMRITSDTTNVGIGELVTVELTVVLGSGVQKVFEDIQFPIMPGRMEYISSRVTYISDAVDQATTGLSVGQSCVPVDRNSDGYSDQAICDFGGAVLNQGIGSIVTEVVGRVLATSDNQDGVALVISGVWDRSPLQPLTSSIDLDIDRPLILWRWLAGSSQMNQLGQCGAAGEFHSSFSPGARYGMAMTQTTASSMAYLFGGSGYATSGASGYLGDMWAFRQTSWGGVGEWAWLSGSTNTVSYRAQYTGQIGAREAISAWFSPPNTVLVNGGNGRDGNNNIGRLSELWSYDTATKSWSWLMGSSTVDSKAVYGTKGTSASSKIPGAGIHRSILKQSDTVLLFGGHGFDTTTRGYLNEVWSYNGQWSWLCGSSVINQKSVAGLPGAFSSTYCPGSRRVSAIMGLSSHVYSYGGDGYSATAEGWLADLWCFDIDTYRWAYVTGDSVSVGSSVQPVYEQMGLFSSSSHPGNVAYVLGWAHNRMDVTILFGGQTYVSSSTLVRQNSLWAFNVSSRQWAWVSGDSVADSAGVYADKTWYNSANLPAARADMVGTFQADLDQYSLFGGISKHIPSREWRNDLWATRGPSWAETLVPVNITNTPTPTPMPLTGGQIAGTTLSILLGAATLLPVGQHTIMPANAPSMAESAQYAMQLVDMFQFTAMMSMFETQFPLQYQKFAESFLWTIPMIPAPFVVHQSPPRRRLLNLVSILQPEFGETNIDLMRNYLPSLLFWLLLSFMLVPLVLLLVLITRRIVLPRRGYINEPVKDDLKALLKKITYSNIRIALICYYGVWVATLLVFSDAAVMAGGHIAMAVMSLLLLCLGMAFLVVWVVRHYTDDERENPKVSATWGVFYARFKSSKPWFVLLEMLQKSLCAVTLVLVSGLAQPILFSSVYASMVICLIVWRPYRSGAIMNAAIIKTVLQLLFAGGNIAIAAYGINNIGPVETIVIQVVLIVVSAISMSLVAYMCFNTGLKQLPGVMKKLVFLLPTPMRRRYRSVSMKGELDVPLLVTDDQSLREPRLLVGTSAPSPGDHDRSWSQRHEHRRDEVEESMI